MKSIWIISQNSGTPKIGGVQRHFFLSNIFNEKGLNTTIIVNAQNHLFSKSLKKKVLKKLDGSYFYTIQTLFKFSKGCISFSSDD